MAWMIKDTICDRCGELKKRLHPAFGRHICDECISKSPKKMSGNAGMVGTGITIPDNGTGLRIVKVKKSDGLFGKLFFEHYPGSKGIPGRSLCYLVYRDTAVIGIIGAASPPYNYKIFREYFETESDNSFVNNNVFRMIVHEKNLGTKVLKLFRLKVYQDYLEKYSERLLGIVTFVEPPRTGSIYKADNWDSLGMTQGKRMRRDKVTWDKVFVQGEQKHIFGYTYDVRTHKPLEEFYAS